MADGEYWFELVVAFRPRDLARVNRVFRDLLGTAGESEGTVQAKFYLSARTVSRLRQQAARRGRTQSDLVEEALRRALA
ncbi:MAG: hypothetical protein A3F84_21240 [Candidatus Handelsmanbacteria bacterium RIFCSPLOWO2_12_FULL_64_10]|uniref:Uncharacterized protein n=1 Tax=Handelsmanbacteria sp. (strain RIFCSPLOWO2_12_FULL_64_10) TaxID=1817868 RepID=A0A1F6D4B2_HANXR|nr:MAG: hypothetical protein A3F84_21240 [Candidatus Handelsmanbacteria bacterium RIFCSPLOWO2_12_FULL_64_10]